MRILASTFGLYLARRVGTSILLVFAGTLALVFIVDFVELIRRAGDQPDTTLGAIALLAAQRTPSVTERALPFAVLFAAMASFLNLSRKLELVVARAAGISAWQVLAPALVVAAVVGLVAVTVYNPVAAELRERAVPLEARLLKGVAATDATRRYIRQRSVDGESIIRARISSDRGRALEGVTAFIFNLDGQFEERVDGSRALLRDGYWEIADARVVRPGSEPESHARYLLATNLTPNQIADSLAPTQATSFWELPGMIALAREAGLPAARYELQYQALLATPALLVTMVLIAATVSFRFFRLGGIARVILIGIVAGFVLYVAGKLAEDIGSAGFVPAALAAWTPAVLGALMSITVLLHQEDG